MAEKTDIEIIRIDTKEAVTNLSELKDYIKDLKETMNEAKIGSDEFKKAQNELDKVVVQQKQIMKGAANEFKAAKGSFNDLNNQLRALKEAWKATGDEMKRNELGKQINDVKAKINEMNHSIGNFQDNVGNYAGSLSPLFDSLGQKIEGLGGKIGDVTNTLGAMGFSVNGLINPIKGLDAGLKMLSANPIIATITLLISLFFKIKDAISANEELQRRWNVAMAAFEPIANAAKNTLDALANAVVWIAEKIGKLISIFSEASKETTELAKAQDELNMSQREFKGNENALRAEAKQLKLLGKETDDYQKKLKYYQDSREKLRAVNQQAVDLAKEELRIAEEKAKLAPNSQADNEKIAALKQKVGQAQEKLNQEDTEYVELINSANNGIKKLNATTGTATDKTKELAAAVERMEQIIADSSKSQVQKLEEEKKKWIDNYRQLKKNTKALEEYFDKKIEKAKEEEREAKSAKIKASRQSFADIESEVAQLTGTDTQGTELADRWLKSLDRVESAYKVLPKKIKDSLTGQKQASDTVNQAYKNYIMSDFFPKKKEIDPYKKEWIDNVTESINDRSTYDDLRVALVELSKGVYQDFGPEGFLNILPEGTISFSSFFREDEINAAKEEYIKIFSELQEKMADETTNQDIITSLRDRLNAQVSIIQNLQEERDIYDEIVSLAVKLNNQAEAKSPNEIWTERFFGTKTDANGFATDGEKLGKALRNSAKVWSDYGNAVTTVLDTIGDAWQKNLERQVKAGRMTEDEARKQFKMIQAMQYSLSVVNAAASVVSIWADPSMGVYQKIATTISVAAQNAAELITIASTNFGDMGGSVDAGTTNFTPAVINDTSPVSYTRNITSADDVDTIADRLGAIKVYVTEKDITDAQNKVRTKVSESRF